MGSVPREQFVPAEVAEMAYIDEDLSVGHHRHLMEPMVLGRLLQAAGPGATEIALCIGGGTGYSAAILSLMTRAVFSLDSESAITALASEKFTQLGYDNAVAVEGELSRGWPDEAPYDVVLFDGAVAEIPQAIFEQLAENGRLMAVVTKGGRPGRATLMQKRGGNISHRDLFNANIPMLPEFEEKASFVF
jgi:protein-L-isoaspartate(D-aspartate) O-methyltransferase